MEVKKDLLKPKTITVQGLIEKAEAFKNKKMATAKLRIDSLDGEITVTEPTKGLMMEALGMDDDKGDHYLVYNCVIEPDLKDPQLQAAMGCSSPLDIVGVIFKPGEISGISRELGKLSGFIGSVKLVEEVKN